MQVQGEEGKKQLTYGLARLANMTPFVLILTDDNWNVLVSVIDMRTEFAATTPLPSLSSPNAIGFGKQTFYGQIFCYGAAAGRCRGRVSLQ